MRRDQVEPGVEAVVALEMKSNCERCGVATPEDADGARICSYECTFCEACAADLSGVCPNCGGELLARPRRRARGPAPP